MENEVVEVTLKFLVRKGNYSDDQGIDEATAAAENCGLTLFGDSERDLSEGELAILKLANDSRLPEGV